MLLMQTENTGGVVVLSGKELFWTCSEVTAGQPGKYFLEWSESTLHTQNPLLRVIG